MSLTCLSNSSNSQRTSATSGNMYTCRHPAVAAIKPK